MLKRVRVFISGKVQKVGFRYFTKLEAKSFNLSGLVRNLDDGRVEAVFEGEEENIKKMLAWCKEGSAPSKVRKVERVEEKVEGLIDFDIL